MMTAPSGFPLETLYNITDISQSKPGVVTLSAVTGPASIAVALGQTVTISKVQGMFQVNDNRYIVGNLDTEAQTFSLFNLQFLPVDTTAYTAYVSGGEMNIISFPPTATNPPGLMYNM
jgi:hypothetical protein